MLNFSHLLTLSKCRSLHTSLPALASKRPSPRKNTGGKQKSGRDVSKTRQPTSRTRLSDDLSSSSRSKNLKIAPSAKSSYEKRPSLASSPEPPRGVKPEPPRRNPFSRDPVPHRSDDHLAKQAERDQRTQIEDARLDARRRRLEDNNIRLPLRRPERSSNSSRPNSGSSPPPRPESRYAETQEPIPKRAEKLSLATREAIFTELYHSPVSTENAYLPSKFTSPPLLPGLIQSLDENLGSSAMPTPIQRLSLKWVLDSISPDDKEGTSSTTTTSTKYKQFLLASETGSGKSLAYLLPLLQGLKLSEMQTNANTYTGESAGGGVETLHSPISPPPPHHQHRGDDKKLLRPRALILAPTHELSRQLASTAKGMSHQVKLSVLSISRDNEGRGFVKDVGLAKERGVDVVVGTPMKTLEMVNGRGWEREEGIEVRGRLEIEKRRSRDEERENDDGSGKEFGRDRWGKGEPMMSMERVEWVVVDEADVLFDPDFQDMTRRLLADISAARGCKVPLLPAPSLSTHLPATSFSSPVPSSQSRNTSPPSSSKTASITTTTTTTPPLKYPFHLLLTSATIPSSLASYISTNHPSLTKLASPGLHKLPKTLKVEHVAWSGGNKMKDVERSIRETWAVEAGGGAAYMDDVDADVGKGVGVDMNGDNHNHNRNQNQNQDKSFKLSKMLVFCNSSGKVEELGAYLKERGVKNIAVTRGGLDRTRGSNRYLAPFLKVGKETRERLEEKEKKMRLRDGRAGGVEDMRGGGEKTRGQNEDKENEECRVLITTSLLSRGLDFSPEVKHVFVVDQPRSVVDFLHRAGRAGRAGAWGRVVIFGKGKGRGSDRGEQVRRRVKALRG